MPDEGVVQDKGEFWDPFGGDSRVVVWPRPLSLAQVRDELHAALGDHVQVAMYGPSAGPDGEVPEVDKDHPVTLFVSPSSVPLAKVKKVLGAHRQDPYYGLSKDEITAAQLREKVASGQALSMEEMNLALRMLVR